MLDIFYSFCLGVGLIGCLVLLVLGLREIFEFFDSNDIRRNVLGGVVIVIVIAALTGFGYLILEAIRQW